MFVLAALAIAFGAVVLMEIGEVREEWRYQQRRKQRRMHENS